MDAREQDIDRILDLLCDLPAEQRSQRLDEMELDAELRARVERMLAIFDETRQGIERILPAELRDGLGDRPLERLGRFRIERSLGEGGMGVVYLARPEGGAKPIALKVMRTQLGDEHARARFRREADVLSRLTHPGICRFVEAGDGNTDDVPLPYLAMEYVEGEPLHEHARHRDLDDRQRVELVARVCDALQHAHERGVIHRDLKPSNVLVEQGEDPIGRPKVLDFGVARARGDDLATLTQTHTGALIGTVAYMSPEQVSGSSRELDARSDVYSLGVMLFELLGGRLPYPIAGEPVPVMARMIQEEEPTRLGAVIPRLAGPIERVTAKALEKNRKHRYASAAALAEDLRRFVRNEEVSVRGTAWVHQARRFARRHRVLVAVTLATFAALVVGLVTTTWFAIGQATARGEAREQAAQADRNAYRAFLSTVAFAIEAGDAGLALRDLEAAPEELRGWEWDHLRASTDESTLLFSGLPRAEATLHQATPGLAFDGEERLWHWSGGRSWSWNLSSGRTLARHSIGEVVRGALTPVAARLSGPESFALLDPAGHVLVEHAIPPGANGVACVVSDAAAADRILVGLRYSGGVLLVDTESGDRRWLASAASPCAAVAPPHWFASTVEGGLRLWNLGNERPPWSYEAGSWGVGRLPSFRDPERLAYPDRDGLVTQWRLRPDGDPRMFQRLSSHRGAVQVVAYSPDGRLLASGGTDRAIHVSDSDTGELLHSFTGHEAPILALRFSEDSRRIASFSEDRTVRVWDLDEGDPRVLRPGCSYL